jgi:N-carbamoyl-L-amino-acid hydrolase
VTAWTSPVALLEEVADIGRDTVRGGYSRHVLDSSEHALREWFAQHAERLGMSVEIDRNANLWAWWGAPGPDSVVTGSHLDSVPGGGAFDGPLGVVSALAAVERLQCEGHRPARPVAIAVFAEEEGSRFGRACLGSQLMTGAIRPESALSLQDAGGSTFADVLQGAGIDPRGIGPDPGRVAMISSFVELHVEQGRGLVDLDAPVAVGSSVVAHGRWRLRLTGQGNHAGTTAMAARRDPLVAAARAIVAARDVASAREHVRATVGRVEPIPGGTNVIASSVSIWLDLRAPRHAEARSALAEVVAAAEQAAAQEGCELEVIEESYGGEVIFDPGLRDRVRATIPDAPVLATGAGHDAGILAAHLPAAMLFVRNPEGISHAPQEHAEAVDCEAGALALADVLRDLTGAVSDDHVV